MAASGQIQARPIFCYAQDGAWAGGSLGEAHADTIVRVLRLAGDARVPVIAVTESVGARLQEATAALSGYARVFREAVALSGHVPQISVVHGTCAGGGCYSPALTDFVIMTEQSRMFLTGPAIVRATLGQECTADELGGTRIHERNGVANFVVPTEIDSLFLARELLGYLPQHTGEQPPDQLPSDAGSARPDADVPHDPRRVYDIRRVIRALVDDGRVLESSARWARNVVTALARIDGRAVGVVANQPRYLGGALDVEAASKAARFVRTCNAFGLPLIVLVDTPGFVPGCTQESRGAIRHGAKLLYAFAEATVPRITLVLRQAYGGAYITMNAKDLGADFVFAWPTARIGVMAASQAVRIVHQRQLDSAEDPQMLAGELAATYAQQHESVWAAAEEGFVDEVIEPADSRARLARALATLEGKVGAPGGTANITL